MTRYPFSTQILNAIERNYWIISRKIVGLTNYKIYHDDPLHEFPAQPFPKFIRSAKTKLKQQHGTWFLDMKVRDETRRTYAFLEKPFDPAKPTIIFHHGAGMINYRNILWLYFFRGVLTKYNLISIKAQAHESTMTFAKNGFNTLTHQTATFAGSVLMVEALVRWLKTQRSMPIVVGASMGGIVATWHWLLFDTAACYFPITAYPNVTEIFLGDGYNGATDHRRDRQRLSAYTKAFVAQAKNPKSSKGNVFPVLGKNDTIVPYPSAQKFWKGYDVLTFPNGHMTTALHYNKITAYIASKLP